MDGSRVSGGCVDGPVRSRGGVDEPMGNGRGVDEPMGSGRGVGEPMGSSRGVDEPMGSGRGADEPMGSGGVDEPIRSRGWWIAQSWTEVALMARRRTEEVGGPEGGETGTIDWVSEEHEVHLACAVTSEIRSAASPGATPAPGVLHGCTVSAGGRRQRGGVVVQRRRGSGARGGRERVVEGRLEI